MNNTASPLGWGSGLSTPTNTNFKETGSDRVVVVDASNEAPYEGLGAATGAIVVATIGGMAIFVLLVIFCGWLLRSRDHGRSDESCPRTADTSSPRSKAPYKIPVVVINPDDALILGSKEPSAHVKQSSPKAHDLEQGLAGGKGGACGGMQGAWRCEQLPGSPQGHHHAGPRCVVAWPNNAEGSG